MEVYKMKDFVDLFQDKNVEFIQFQFTTILGDFKGVEFPVSIWEEMKHGTGIDGSSIGILETEQSDMRIVPDLDTFSILPWNPKIARFICDIHDNQGFPHPCCTRALLKGILKDAADMGYNYKTRPELEWYFLNHELEPADSASYMDLLPNDMLDFLRREIANEMMKMGLDIKTIHHENGPGQQEIEFQANEALKQADNLQTAKLISKIKAQQNDLIATYLPKPIPKVEGSGLHIHQYLTQNGENVFADEKGGISQILRYYIGGIQKHINSISAILNPITNSYKRLVAHYEAPVYISWGVSNRTALIRVPGYEESARIEYRAGDGAMNIYLGSGILLAAGLNGIKNKIEPTRETTKNIYKMDAEERETLGIKILPRSLEESLDYFEESEFIKNILGNDLFTSFLKKKQEEIQAYKKAKSNNVERAWEFDHYLNC